MPDRYWVGGTASWDATAGTKWATTSGGAGGASVPTAADDVFFNAASGAVTVSVNTTIADCRNLNCTGFTGTLTRTTGTLRATGSITLSSAMTLGSSLPFQLEPVGSQTLLSAGKTFGSTFDIGSQGSTGTITLQDALTSSSAITVTRGTFTTNNFNVTATSLSSNNSNTRTINLGSSTVTLSATSGTINFNNNAGLTFNAGTSTIVCSGAGSNITSGSTGNSGNGVTFYNVSYTSTTASTHAVLSINTFNNITVTAPATAGVTQVTFDSRQTINGTLSTTGTAGNRRVWFRGATYGIAQTLTINSAPSLTDADFRDIYVIGTAAPISGTRIGDLRGCRGITFDAPKTVYWSSAAGGTWSATNWAATSGGATSNDNFPLAQDTAVIENTGLNASATVTLNATLPFIGTLDMSTRTNAATISISSGNVLYGNLVTGSGITYSGAQVVTFSGRNTQTITSAGKTFSGGITIDSYGGTVQLADALDVGANTLTVTNGTFNTQSYSVTAGTLASSNSNVRAITLGSSTVTLNNGATTWNFTNSANLVFSAGTSQINIPYTPPTFNGGGLTFNNIAFTNTSSLGVTVTGQNTFNNFSVTASASAGLSQVIFSANQTITGTLTCAGATAVRRIFLCSDTLGTTRTLTVNSLSAQDCDFRDITIAGVAAGSSPTRAGDCGGNTGITFPAPKTVYAIGDGSANNLGTVGWATSSGGTPDINNFPLAQDTAVIDNTTNTPTLFFTPAFNLGSINSSTRSSAITFTNSSGTPSVYGNFTFGTGVSSASAGNAFIFSGRGTQTITSNGVSFGCPITIDSFSGTVQLADALTLNSARTLNLTSGTFDAVTYNVTTGLFATGSGTKTLRMGSGTWTLSGTGSVWDASGGTTNFFKGTANIVLSDTSTAARTFLGNNFSYNRLTIGGTTGTSTLTINNNNNQFTELASTKTVAHTIALGTTTQTFGAWTVTGTAGNVVTVTGTATITIAGARVSGVDYLALGTTVISATSPGEFYAGANSTGGTNAILTAAPAPVTRYWRGGTGTWDATTTTNWSATSGGAGGASVPTSADAVVFNSASNATAYTVTCTATQLRCASLTMAGPGTGNVTWAGTAPLAIHGNVSLAATGITRTFVGSITLSGSATGRTFTTNGVSLGSSITVNGVGCGWVLGSALDIAVASLTVTNGAFDTSTYNLTATLVTSANSNSRTVTFGSGTITLSANTAINFGNTLANAINLTFNAGTSTISLSAINAGIVAINPSTFYNLSFTSTALNSASIFSPSTFNNITVAGRTSSSLGLLIIDSFDITISGTLTFSAGTDATCRTFLRSVTSGTTRTLTCAAVSATDVDFRDIVIAGAAAPVSGTRLGDCKGNSGITFPAPKTVYWQNSLGGNWGASNVWALTIGGATAANNFPLPQDTAVFQASVPNSGSTISINGDYNIGTIDMSARTSNTMTLALGSLVPLVYGNWINGTGLTLTGASTIFFTGRGSQTITCAGVPFSPTVSVNSPGGTVTLQDAFLSTRNNVGALTVITGTFNANNYNVTLTAPSAGFTSTSTSVRTVNVGSGTWTLPGTGAWNISNTANLTLTGTGTISLTSASAKTFAGGGISYSGITLNQGGAGTLTITGDNTFANITNSYKATGATTIAMGTTTQRVGNFTASGEAGRVLTVQGSSAASPATLIYTGTGQAAQPAIDYLTITGVRAYSLDTTWYAGANSTNNGSLGWYFDAGGGGPITVFIIENATATDAASATGTFNPTIAELITGSDAATAGFVYLGTLSESATAEDVARILDIIFAAINETTSAQDLNAVVASVFNAAAAEIALQRDTPAAQAVFSAFVDLLPQPMADVAVGTSAEGARIFNAASFTDGAQVYANGSGSGSAGGFNLGGNYLGFPADNTSPYPLASTIVLDLTQVTHIAVTLIAGNGSNGGVSYNADMTIALQYFNGTSYTFLPVATVTPAAARPSAITVNAAIPTIGRVSNAFFMFFAFGVAPPPVGVSWGIKDISLYAVGATATDSSTNQYLAFPQIAEVALGVESVSSLGVFGQQIVEVAGASDQSSVAPSVFNAAAAEFALQLDAVQAAAAFPVTLTEAAQLTDAVLGAYLWNPIDDTQNPNWQNVVNSQGSGWVQVNTDDTPNWQPTIEP